MTDLERVTAERDFLAGMLVAVEKDLRTTSWLRYLFVRHRLIAACMSARTTAAAIRMTP